MLSISSRPTPTAIIWPFTATYNKRGRIRAPRVLEALRASGAAEAVLILEVIPAFEADDRRVLDELQESVAYWKQAITDLTRHDLPMNDRPVGPTLDDVAEEGRRLAVAAQGEDLSLRLLGGVAVWCQCPSARLPELSRAYGDADFIGRGGDRKRITGFLEAQGYEADRMFNALHGATRLNFHDAVRDRPLDVLLDRFTMAHELDLRDSVSADGLTIALADLLMTKLQVVNVNEKDVRDLIALLLDHDLGPTQINIERILEATKNDWGLEHTFHRSLSTLQQMLGSFGLADAQQQTVAARASELGSRPRRCL